MPLRESPNARFGSPRETRFPLTARRRDREVQRGSEPQARSHPHDPARTDTRVCRIGPPAATGVEVGCLPRWPRTTACSGQGRRVISFRERDAAMAWLQSWSLILASRRLTAPAHQRRPASDQPVVNRAQHSQERRCHKSKSDPHVRPVDPKTGDQAEGKKVKVATSSPRVRSRQAAHVAQPTKSTSTSSGKIPKPEMSENERYSTRSTVLMEPPGLIDHSTPEERTGVVQIRAPATKHQTRPGIAEAPDVDAALMKEFWLGSTENSPSSALLYFAERLDAVIKVVHQNSSVVVLHRDE